MLTQRFVVLAGAVLAIGSGVMAAVVPAPAIYYNFNGKAGDAAAPDLALGNGAQDATLTRNTLINGSAYTVDAVYDTVGKFGAGVKLAQAQQRGYVAISGMDRTVWPSDGFTIAGWFRSAAQDPNTQEKMLFALRSTLKDDGSSNTAGGSSQFAIQINRYNGGGANKGLNKIIVSGGGSLVATANNAFICDDTYHHLAVSVTRSTGLVHVYIDGTESAIIPPDPTWGGGVNKLALPANFSLGTQGQLKAAIGMDVPDSVTNFPVEATGFFVDDFAIFGSALDADQVHTIATAPGDLSTVVPEPAALGLVGVAGLALRRRRCA